MSTRTGRVVRWVRSNGTRYAVIEPHLTPAETEAEADALVASLPAADQREIEAQRLRDALARIRARRTRKRLTAPQVKRVRPSQPQEPVIHRYEGCSAPGGRCEHCDWRLRA